MKLTTLLWRLAIGSLLPAVLAGCPQVPPADPLPPAPRVVSFTASQANVAAGTTVTLSWAAEDATEVKIDELRLGSVSGVSGVAGEVEVSITDDSLFVLTARNARGASDTAVVAVRVGAGAGELLFTALPSSVEAGEPVTLAWSAPGATTVSLAAAPGGAIDPGGQGASGSVTVFPAASTTYTLNAGVSSATTSVTVLPTLLTFTASSLAVDAGSTVTLSWTTANATRVQLTAPGRGTLVDEMSATATAAGSFDDVLPTVVGPGQLFPYQLTVTGPGRTVTRSLTVTILGNPTVISFTAPTLARQADGTLPLTWLTAGADQVSITADGVEIYRATDPALAGSGTLDVPVPAADAVFVLTARASRGGAATATRAVEVVGVPSVTLTATPASVAAGAPVTLTWSGQSIRGVVISEVGAGTVHQASGMMDTGSATVLPNRDTTYSIVVDNGLGDRATATAPVTVTSPVALSVAETGTLRLMQNVTLSWAAPGTPALVGVAHDFVDTRPASTGFDDISQTGTKLTFPTTGHIVARIDTPFRTVLFGKTVGEQITVSRYGYLVFGWANGANSTNVALPNTKLEPLAVAPYWESLTVTGVYWQVKSVSGVPALIVQWQSSTADFQAKLFASGQIDFEYANLPTTVSGHVGITGLRREQTVVGPTPAENQGLTFFGPQPAPLTMRVLAEGPLVGHLELAPGQLLRVSTDLPDVVRPDELIINEALRTSTVGVPGQWAELRNARDTAVDLTAWSLGFADGGSIALSGSVPPRGVLVVGASADPALNDDAGVQVELANFNLTGQTTLALGRGGTLNSLVVADGGVGAAWVNDVGPWKYNPSATGPGRCAATAPYGAQGTPQLGTPGLDRGCGFPYALTSRSPGYFDISATGTPLMTNLDNQIATVSLTAAPVPFFGVARTSMQVSTNGFLTFETAAASPTNYVTSSTPSTSDSNLMLAVFADNLIANQLRFADAQVFAQRVGAGVDPFAAPPHWIVQWHHFSYSTTTANVDNYNFQVKLFDDGVIEYHYDAMESVTSSQYAAGTSAVSWLENDTGTQALLINAISTTPGISPRSAFRFAPR